MYCTYMRGTTLRRNYSYDKPTSAYHVLVTFYNIATFKREYVWEKVSRDTVFVSPWSLSCLNRGYYRDRFRRLFPYSSIFCFSPHAPICRAEHPIITLTRSRSALSHRRPVHFGPQGETALLVTTSSHLVSEVRRLPKMKITAVGTMRRKTSLSCHWLLLWHSVYILRIMQCVCSYASKRGTGGILSSPYVLTHTPNEVPDPFTCSHFIYGFDTLIKDRTANGNTLINIYRHQWQMASYLTYIRTAEAHQSYLITSLSNVTCLCRTIVGEC